MTGTPEFFDSRQGVASLPPPHDRIKFTTHGGFASQRQPQLQLEPFGRDRLIAVATRLRDEYPSQHPQRHRAKITDALEAPLGELRAASIPATAEEHTNGHVDLTVRHPNGRPLRYLGECKIWDGVRYPEKGMGQLLEDYSTGRDRRGCCMEFMKTADTAGKLRRLRASRSTTSSWTTRNRGRP